MHDNHIMHRDIKPENILLTFVLILLCRIRLKYVILDGQCIVPRMLGKPYVELLFISHLKFWKGKRMMKKLTLGLLAL